MVPSRRRLLRSGFAAATGVLGVTAATGRRGTQADASGTDPDPTVHTYRVDDGDAILFERTDGKRRRIANELVSTPSRLSHLEFPDSVAEADAEAAWSFLDATDFTDETIYVVAESIESCYRRRYRSVSWEAGAGRMEYRDCRELRPPDVACRADTRETVGVFFRLPVAIDATISGRSTASEYPCEGFEREWAVIEPPAEDGSE